MSKRQLDELTTAQVLCQLSYAGSPIIARQGDAVAEWCDDPLYRQISDEMLFDPLLPAVDSLGLTDPASRPDGSWCEDRDPATGALTDADGRE